MYGLQVEMDWSANATCFLTLTEIANAELAIGLVVRSCSPWCCSLVWRFKCLLVFQNRVYMESEDAMSAALCDSVTTLSRNQHALCLEDYNSLLLRSESLEDAEYDDSRSSRILLAVMDVVYRSVLDELLQDVVTEHLNTVYPEQEARDVAAVRCDASAHLVQVVNGSISSLAAPYAAAAAGDLLTQCGELQHLT
jgi:hypothetical protein